MDGCITSVTSAAGNLEMTAHFPENDAMDRQAYKSRNSVAIIEDEPDLVDVYVRLCTLKNLRISFIAYDGIQAVEIFKNTPLPDVILIDHRMPNMTGINAMKKMLEIDPDAKFVVLSADEEVQDEALTAGARAFMKKPASLMEIYAVIAKVLDGSMTGDT
jgi:two-component system chemotaxis response regulator CheY